MTTLSTLANAASRDALAATELQLLQAIEGASAQEATALSDELFDVAGLLGEQTALRRGLADTAVEPESREQLVRDLLASRLSQRSLSVLVEAARARWSDSRDLMFALERLARIALLVQAERAGDLDTVEDELFRLGRIVGAEPELERLLSDPTAAPAGKVEVAESLVKSKVEPVTWALVRQLVSRSHGQHVGIGLEQLAELSAQRRERSVAHVSSAVPLDEAQQQRLATTLQRMYGRPIAVHLEVDPELRGGLTIRIGDEVIDGSILGQLQALRRHLAE